MQQIINLLKKAGVKSPILEIPSNSELGDYAFPCFFLAKKLKKNPNEIALEIVEKLKQKKLPEEIKEIKSINGYVNFFINKNILAEKTLKQILNKKRVKKKKEKALIEHTSINPNASPHVGRSRNAFIGDFIKRILEYQGYKTEVHYYVNDVSKQIAMLALICTGKEKFSQLLNKYVEIAKKVNENPELEEKVFEILNKFENNNKKITNKINKIVKTAVKGQEKILSKLNIKYDYFDYESDYLKKQKEILKKLQKTKKLFTDADGRKVLNQKNTKFKFEEKMRTPVFVLTRNDNTGLYPLRDIAYTIDKLKKTRKNIIVLGEDQKLYFQQLSAALELLKQKVPEVIHYSFVLIKTDKGKEKMSTRKGELVLLEDFMQEAIKKAKQEAKKRKAKGDIKKIEKIAYGAIKYIMLKNDPNRNIVFDWQEAMNFEGNSGPYLQYTYARATSILRKSKKKPKVKISNLEDIEKKLITKLSQFSQTIEKAEKQYNPALICNYSFELAQIFNEFYHSCKVIGSEQEESRLAVVEATRQVLKSALNLLGIDVLEEM